MTISRIKKDQETQVPGAHKVANTVVKGSKAGALTRTLRKKEEQRIQQDIAQYRYLKQIIDAHQAELKEIQGRLLDDVQKDPDGRIFIEDGSYSVCLVTKAKWTYSLALQKDILYIEAEKKSEQQNGTAKNNPTQFVRGIYTARS